MPKKYDRKDFQAIVDKKKTIQEIADKYGVKKDRIQNQMNRAGYFVSTRKILVISPYGTKECSSVREVADEICVSAMTVYKALQGKRVRILEELEITLKEITNVSLEIN